jgi:hypothetical protein
MPSRPRPRVRPASSLPKYIEWKQNAPKPGAFLLCACAFGTKRREAISTIDLPALREASALNTFAEVRCCRFPGTVCLFVAVSL